MELKMNKKAVFFIADALVFFIIISSAIAVLPNISNDSQNNNQLTFTSKDFIGILMEMKVGEMNDSWIQTQISNGNISDSNNSLLDQIGEFWSKSQNELAYNISNIIIEEIVPSHLGGGIWIDDELVYSKSNPPKNHIVSGRQIVSGLEKNKPVKGYVARAWAQNLKSNNIEVISISPEGAGVDYGNVVITKYFNLSNTTINGAELTLSVHADQSDTRIWVDFNDGQCHYVRGDLSWLYGSSDGNVGLKDVSTCINSGVNKFEIYLENRGYNGHIHPGTNIKINVTRNITQTINSVNIRKKFYLDNVLSTEVSNDNSGAWVSFPFYIPEDATNISTSVNIVGNNIRDYTGNSWFRDWNGNWKRRRDYDYIMFLNDNSPLDYDSNPTTSATYNYNHAALSGNLVTGTNMISVYFNNYGDAFWGDGWTEIYSDEFGDPEGSSFVEVNYTMPSEIPYGLVELTGFEEFSGSDDHDKTLSFEYPEEASLKGEAFLYLVQRYSDSINVWADTFNPPTTDIFETPSMRAVPTETYIDSNNFEINYLISNYVRARDVGSGNEIIADLSSLEYNFYIPSFVSYEGVFASQAEAVEDALTRLNESIGAFLDVGNIVTSNDSITEVPTLWGPSVVEVRLWD